MPVELRTERLLLRSFTLADVEDVLEYANDSEWARYQINIPPVPYTRKDAEALVAFFQIHLPVILGIRDYPLLETGRIYSRYSLWCLRAK